MPDSTHNVARRTALIFAGIILAFLGATLAWLYPEVKRVVRERKQRQTENARGIEMVPVPGNSFTMGANDGAPEEKPLHDVRVNPFLMDKTEVTNEQFAQFVTATSYVTTAERPPAGADKLPPEQRAPGSWCFRFSPDAKASGRRPWAQWVPGANWRQPDGPGSNIEGCGKFPVVHVSWDDAVAFAKWSGKRLPTEAEWECAARGAVVLAHFPWGMEACPDGRWRANVWQGVFPAKDDALDGFAALAPVGSYSLNNYRLADLAGNAAEWCADWFAADYYGELRPNPDRAAHKNPQGPDVSNDPAEPGVWKRVVRGGSWLSTDVDFRVSTRGREEPGFSAAWIGFRCVKN